MAARWRGDRLAGAIVHEVLQAAGRGHQHIHPLPQRLRLRLCLCLRLCLLWPPHLPRSWGKDGILSACHGLLRTCVSGP